MTPGMIEWHRRGRGLLSARWWITEEGRCWALWMKTPGTQGAFRTWQASFPRQRDCKRWAEILEAQP